ncbi:MAG: hypothetical protein CVU28_10640, partial [Betaproteobacteria bacterium HGW-Betaproteobacteria-21]
MPAATLVKPLQAANLISDTAPGSQFSQPAQLPIRMSPLTGHQRISPTAHTSGRQPGRYRLRVVFSGEHHGLTERKYQHGAVLRLRERRAGRTRCKLRQVRHQARARAPAAQGQHHGQEGLLRLGSLQ